jgi:hypothetical protein
MTAIFNQIFVLTNYGNIAFNDRGQTSKKDHRSFTKIVLIKLGLHFEIILIRLSILIHISITKTSKINLFNIYFLFCTNSNF